MISLGARASGPQCAVRGDKPSVGASAHQRGGSRPSLISLSARASGPQGAVRGDSASVGASAH